MRSSRMDGCCSSAKTGVRGAVLLEIDRGTEFQLRFKEHMAARLKLVEEGRDLQLYGGKTAFVVYLSVGDLPYRQTRRQTMAQWTKEALQRTGKEEWGRLFRFTDVGLKEMYGANLFDAAVWFPPDAPQPVRLLGA